MRRDPGESSNASRPGVGRFHALSERAVDAPSRPRYTHFAFRYAPSAIAAFEKECRDYHELGGSENLDNHCHPEPPPDSPWACPVHG